MGLFKKGIGIFKLILLLALGALFLYLMLKGIVRDTIVG